jgi:hypothetical protein
MDEALPFASQGMDGPSQPGAKQAERAERERRLAKALRDNLRRRKEQMRAQQQRGAALPKKGAGGDGEPSA